MALAAQSEISIFLLLLVFSLGTVASFTLFTIENRCSYTVWPGILAGEGATILPSCRDCIFSSTLLGPNRCIFDGAGKGKCATGDCEGGLRCTGGGARPVMYDKDSYEVSVAEGYNVGIRGVLGDVDEQMFHHLHLFVLILVMLSPFVLT